MRRTTSVLAVVALIQVTPTAGAATPELVGAYPTLGGQLVPLRVDSTRLTLEREPGVSTTEALALVAEAAAPATPRVVLDLTARGVLLLALDGPVSVAVSGALASVPQIAWAMPGVVTDRGVPLGVTPDLIVTHADGSRQGVRSDATTLDEAFAECEALALDAEVQFAHPNLVREKTRYASPPNDPLLDQQWYLHNHGQGGQAGADIGVLEAWDHTMGSASVVLAVIDDAFDLGHPDLAGDDKIAAGQVDLLEGDDDPSPGPGDFHGTPVAGVATAGADDGVGVAGVCPRCRLLPIRQGYTDLDDIAAFDHAASHGAHVVNASWGYSQPSLAVVGAIQDAIAHGRGGLGTLVIFAAGNDDADLGQSQHVAATPGVLTVAASTAWAGKSPYSNWGDEVELSAPVDGFWAVTTAAQGGGYTSDFGGTSAASPMVTGVAGLLFAVAPSRTQQEVFDLLVATAEPIGVGYDAGGHSLAFGYGRVDAAAALAAPSDAAVIDEPGPGEASCQDYWACLHTCEAPAGACDVSCRSGLTSAASASLDALLGCIEDHKCYEGPEPFESCLLSACGVEVDSCFGTVASGSSEGLVPSPGSRDVATTTTLEIGAPADDEAPELDAPPEAGCGAGSHSEPGGIPSGWLLLLVSTLLVTRWGLRGAA